MLEIGQEISILVWQENRYESYRSKVMDLANGFFYIEYPVHVETNKTVYLFNGTTLHISFVTENKEAYQCITSVVGRIKDPVPLVQVVLPKKEEFLKIQRREFVRINRAVDVSVHPMEKEFKAFQTKTDDISAGGASFLIPKTVPMINQQMVKLWLVLPRITGEYHYFTLTSRVVRTTEYNEKMNLVSVEFIDKTPQQEQKLLQFCYESQVLLKQKELNI